MTDQKQFLKPDKVHTEQPASAESIASAINNILNFKESELLGATADTMVADDIIDAIEEVAEAMNAKEIPEDSLVWMDGEPKGIVAAPDLKFDQGKARMDLILDGFPDALEEIGKCATFGAEKYEAHSWLHVANAKARYRAAGFRHELRGEGIDPESGLLHAAHHAWNALAHLQLLLNEGK